jgi:hypothetical protein
MEMKMNLKKILLVLWPVLSALIPLRQGLAQTTINPDISFIGDMRLTGLHDAPPDVGENKMLFDFHELEITAGSLALM